MSCKEKHCHPYPIEPAPFAPGSCDPHPHCPPRPPMPCAPCPPSQYIGSRYVPIFADPIEWDIHRSYESLTIVTHDGESYTSKCNVGPGVDITNARYWAKTGAYNAQVEQYKNEVKDLSSQVTGFASDNAEFREKIDQFTKDNAEMKNTVAEDKSRVDALAERVATSETEIDGLQATTAQHTTELANLHAKDEDLQRQITSNDNDIAALQAKDVEQDSRLNGIDTKLRSHDATLAQNTADIAKNTKNIQDNAVAIAQNAHELADHAEQLNDHEARLTSQHQEITANHQAIERNTSDIASLRADLTEDEAKIEANRDAIAHIQEKDVQQDNRLDALEQRTTTAENRLDGLDTKTDATNTALTAEVDRAKAAELANGKLIAQNAAELADHAEELADHETRITALEGDNSTNKQEIADIKAKNTAQDTVISGNTDAIAHINDSLAGYVTNETYTAGQAEQNIRIGGLTTTVETLGNDIATYHANVVGEWHTDHPGQTVSEAVSTLTSKDAAQDGRLEELETNKADKQEIADIKAKNTAQDTVISGNTDAIAHINDSLAGYVTNETYTAGQAEQNIRIGGLTTTVETLGNDIATYHANVVGEWHTDHPGQTVSEAVSTLTSKDAAQDGRLEELEKLFTFDTISDMCKAAKNIILRVSNRTDNHNNGSILYTPLTTNSSASITINNAVFEAYLPYPFSCAENRATLKTTGADITVYASVPEGTGAKVTGYQIIIPAAYLVFNAPIQWIENMRKIIGTVSVHSDGSPLSIPGIPANATVLGIVINARFY